MRSEQIVNGWRMRKAGEDTWLSAVVPGSVYGDLLRNGRMEDPFWKDNELRALPLMEEDYEYEAVFSCEISENSRVWLTFPGLDTIADVYVNGVLAGRAENMHRTWDFDITGMVKAENNVLHVHFHSPLAYIREKYAKQPTQGSVDGLDGFVHIRKAHYMFGWDWGAHLPDAGIYRPVYLRIVEKGRIDSVYIRQEHRDGKVILDLNVFRNPAEDLKREIPVCSREERKLPGAAENCANHGMEKTLEVGKAVGGKAEALEVGEAVGGKTEASEGGHDYRGIAEASGDGYTYCVRVTAPDGSVTEDKDSPKRLTINNPCLWWPNGVGEQPLYQIEVTLYHSGREVDVWTKRIGLRTMTMHIEKDEWGTCFAHRVNGVDIFAMGADYIPEDHILARVTPSTTRKLLEQCRLANFNVIRVWGGGYYPEDWFYDLCDEMGFMVWQDFMFACAAYDLTPEFEENIRAEFVDNIKRLRHHASLGLWCGNNEMEQFVLDGICVTRPSEVRDYIIMYERLIPEVLKCYDPVTFYWPASPSSGGSFDHPQDPDRGDVHYWDVWHGNKPFTEYRKFYFRYVSEFGFQSFPAMKTIESFTDDPADWNAFSYIMEKHQRNAGANGKILTYLQQTFLYPTAFTTLLYASQLLQAEAIKYGVEHFRRNRGRCMGAVYWQLNDCWPVASWSSIDYQGRWKALHYYARRFFAPVMISCEEHGWIMAEEHMNREHFKLDQSIRLNVTNETMTEREITVKWALRDSYANILEEKEEKIHVPALSSVWMDRVEYQEADCFSQYISYEAWEKGDCVSEGTVIFALPKYFHFRNPNLSYRIEGDEIIVSAGAYAKSVEIQNEEENLILSDNYFDMNAGEKRVRILGRAAREYTENAGIEELVTGGLHLKSVYDIR